MKFSLDEFNSFMENPAYLENVINVQTKNINTKYDIYRDIADMLEDTPPIFRFLDSNTDSNIDERKICFYRILRSAEHNPSVIVPHIINYIMQREKTDFSFIVFEKNNIAKNNLELFNQVLKKYKETDADLARFKGGYEALENFLKKLAIEM